MAEMDPVYKELAVKIGQPKSKVMPRIFQKLVNLEEAKILNTLPATAEDLANKLNIDKKKVDKFLKEAFEKGIVFSGKSGFRMNRTWGTMHDSLGSADMKKYKELDKEFLELCEEMAEEANTIMVEQVKRGEVKNVRQAMRVVPRWKAIKDIPGVLPIEDVRQMLKAADTLTIVNCPCKVLMPSRKCKGKVPLKTCVQIGRAAEYNLERGTGQKITYDEVMTLLEDLDNYQVVHLTGNSTKQPALMCNCHECCCGAFRRNVISRKYLNQFSIARSRFIASVDAEKCRACKTCVEIRCPIGAAQMKYYPELGKERAYTDTEVCIGCGLCVIACPAKARKLNLVRPPEHIPEPDAGPYAATT